jgi:hypothetical protein
MVLWLLAYIIIGQVAMPICLSMMGMSADDLSARGHALMHLCLDVAQVRTVESRVYIVCGLCSRTGGGAGKVADT